MGLRRLPIAGAGATSYFRQGNGTRQLVEVSLLPHEAGSRPSLVLLPQRSRRRSRNLSPPRYSERAATPPTPVHCEKLLVKSNFGADEKNTETQRVVVLHPGRPRSAVAPDRIHGVHWATSSTSLQTYEHYDSVGGADQRGWLEDCLHHLLRQRRHARGDETA